MYYFRRSIAKGLDYEECDFGPGELPDIRVHTERLAGSELYDATVVL